MKKPLYSLATKAKVSNRSLLILIVLLMVPLFFVSKALFTGIAQTNEKKQKKMTKETFKNEPIEFVELKSSGKKFKFGEKYIQESDWLKELTFDFKNVSGKTITYIGVAIIFPETQSTGVTISHSLSYGIPPNFPESEYNKSKLLIPNETAQIGFSAESYKALKNFLATRNHTLTDLTQAHLTIMSVFFEDGTKWGAGDMYRPDPNKPGKYIAIDEKPGGNNEKK